MRLRDPRWMMSSWTFRRKRRTTMDFFSIKGWASSLALIGIVSCGAAVATAQTATPVPKFTKLPITFYAPEMSNSPSDNFPLDTISRNLRPKDLNKAGYVEEEYI